MSTHSTIKAEHNDDTGIGFKLYTDWLDECAGDDVVNLRLDGMPFEASANGGLSVKVTIPRAIAERLGLVQPDTK